MASRNRAVQFPPTPRHDLVDDDGTFLTILTAPDTLEMCRTEVTASSMLVGCRQLTRQR